ncbi:hypothetical protein [Bacillus altitudinis]|uniref:hypothetical protein n=1 Tax=Bacillus altitudinis TaxID=293387 RepID=UPI001643E1FC|nr:hypothetical protein [Bacillus altitudinis]
MKEILKGGLEVEEDEERKGVVVCGKKKGENRIVNMNGEGMGEGKQGLMVGGCGVER